MKQMSKVLAFGENFCSGAYGISGNKTDKAPFDKTYPAIILGVNQKFTDDVSDDEQSAIIEKFSIPETIEEGENNYYTFKINGAYYVKSQNGDFKLYDKIMVYVPNGDWSNMYFDYPNSSYNGNNRSSDSIRTGHQLIVNTTPPGGGNPQLDDMWLFVKDENNIGFSDLKPSDYVGMYTYQEDNETNIQEWKTISCTIGQNIPTSDNVTVGNLWIQTKDGNFNKIYICTQVSEGAQTWSEIYPEDETGGEHNLFISASLPVADGDFWAQIDSDITQNILAFYEYCFNSETSKYEWRFRFAVNGGSGSEFHVSVDEPKGINEGDFLATMSDETTVTNLQRYVNGSWTSVNFQQGSSPPAVQDGLYFCIVASGALRVILTSESGNWQAAAPSSYPPAVNEFYINEAPTGTIKPGDLEVIAS